MKRTSKRGGNKRLKKNRRYRAERVLLLIERKKYGETPTPRDIYGFIAITSFRPVNLHTLSLAGSLSVKLIWEGEIVGKGTRLSPGLVQPVGQ